MQPLSHRTEHFPSKEVVCTVTILVWPELPPGTMSLIPLGSECQNVLLIGQLRRAFLLTLILLSILQVVGTVTMFVWPAPMLLKQAYMVATGVIMAFLFTGIPEWTTWILLVAMAIYDIAAVLTPNGPLKVLFTLSRSHLPLTLSHPPSEGHLDPAAMAVRNCIRGQPPTAPSLQG